MRPKAQDRFDSLCSEWLDLRVPSGWTYTPREMGSIDFVGRLALCEALLWNWELCEGPLRTLSIDWPLWTCLIPGRGCRNAPDRVSSALEP